MAGVAVPLILIREILALIRRLWFLAIPVRPRWCMELLKIGFWNVGQGRVVCENGGWENKKKRVFDVFARLFSGS